jgi:hypothetical protein
MITNDSSFPGLDTRGAKVENQVKLESKAIVDNKSPAITITIKGERDVMPIGCDVKVKVKENTQVKVESLFPGAKTNLTNIPTGTDVVCFNPLIHHCFTDPTIHGVNKFSCYVSAKTCNTQIAITHGNEGIL